MRRVWGPLALIDDDDDDDDDIYYSWVYTRWQWSVVLYRNSKETAQKEKQY
jgi:hypothetical protein